MTKPQVPLEGQRILQVTPAQAGWTAWFDAEDDNFTSLPVACWVWVETQNRDALGAIVREHEVVPYVCGGISGVTDATLLDGYLGLSGPGEENKERLKKLAADLREAEKDAGPEDE